MVVFVAKPSSVLHLGPQLESPVNEGEIKDSSLQYRVSVKHPSPPSHQKIRISSLCLPSNDLPNRLLNSIARTDHPNHSIHTITLCIPKLCPPLLPSLPLLDFPILPSLITKNRLPTLPRTRMPPRTQRMLTPNSLYTRLSQVSSGKSLLGVRRKAPVAFFAVGIVAVDVCGAPV